MNRVPWRLLVVLAVLVLVVGCLQTAPTDDPARSDVAVNPPPVGPCPDGVERMSVEADLDEEPSERAGFRLSANATRVERGETIRFSLRNVADERRSTGTADHYLLQRRGPDGWRSVLGVPRDRAVWNATAIPHEPGTGYEWTVPLNGADLPAGPYRVCGSLPSGEYRFVFAGIVDSEDERSDGRPSVAVQFELVPGNG